jgi:hypothetical protein
MPSALRKMLEQTSFLEAIAGVNLECISYGRTGTFADFEAAYIEQWVSKW